MAPQHTVYVVWVINNTVKSCFLQIPRHIIVYDVSLLLATNQVYVQRLCDHHCTLCTHAVLNVLYWKVL